MGEAFATSAVPASTSDAVRRFLGWLSVTAGPLSIPLDSAQVMELCRAVEALPK